MVYSGIYLLPKSTTSTIKSEQSNLTNNSSQPNVTNNVSNHMKHSNSKKLSSTGSTNRSSESSRFNETNSNVTIKSDLNKFNKSPKLAPEIIFLIKEHAKTLETINQISKKLQEIELKVDDISQRLSKENSLNVATDLTHVEKNDHLKIDSHHQKELNQTRLPYSTYKDVDQLSNNHLSNNLSNNATNIPNNQILSDDSGGEYGNKTTTKTVSDDDELLSILEKITKCSHHILQTQQAYQQQGTAIYNSLSKPYAYQQPNLISNQFNNNNNQQSHNLQHAVSHQSNRAQYHTNDLYHTNNATANLIQQPQPNLYSAMNNPYLLNAKSPIKTVNNLNTQPNHHLQQQQPIVSMMKFNNTTPVAQAASLNELLFEPNVERFLSNLDQMVCNDDTNLAAILGTQQQQQHQSHLIGSSQLPMLQQHNTQNQQQFIPLSPHHQTSTPISSQPIPILSTGNLRGLNANLSHHHMPTLNNSSYANMINVQPYHDPSLNSIRQQQYVNWAKAKELLEKKERERIDNQMKQADEWLGNVNNCINRQNNNLNNNKTSTKQATLQNNLTKKFWC